MFFLFLFLAVPEAIAFYPLNARYKSTEKENRQPKGILGDVGITNGPYNEPGGSYMFYGTYGSYIEFPNNGGLDTRFSITLMCWVQPGRIQNMDRGPWTTIWWSMDPGPCFVYVRSTQRPRWTTIRLQCRLSL